MSLQTRIAVWMLVIIGCCQVGLAQDRKFWPRDPYEAYDRMMYVRPEFSLPGSYLVHQEGLKELWLKALDRPDPGLQRMIVDTLAIAHERGVPDLEDTSDRLVTLLKNPDTREDLKRSIVQTLIRMDAKQHADAIADFSKESGSSISTLVETTLTRWDSDVYRDAWLQRVKENTASTVAMCLAVEGLAALQEADSVAPIKQIVSNPGQPTKLRIVAARNLALLSSEGLVGMARELLMESSRHPELPSLLAIELVSEDESREAVDLLTSLLANERTAVQSRALERLYEIDFQLVDEQAERFVGSPDASVRRWIAKSMFDSKRVERIELLANLLDDPVPSLRREVADQLIELGAAESLKEEVNTQCMRILNNDSWRGCEQACVVLAELDFKPSGSRMVELLKHPRGEVKVASAWGLSKIRVAKHLPDMVEHATEIYQGFKAGEFSAVQGEYDHQLAHLFLAFGDQNYQPSSEILLSYVPRDDSLGFECRTAACWAIGMLNIDNPEPKILKLLDARIRDVGMFPEREETRQMSAISIGRMKGESELGTLREFGKTNGLCGRACQWSIERLTGEPMKELEDVADTNDGYFLTPLVD